MYTIQMLRINFLNKQAISPVISTILLIAATIIIAVTVFQFLQGYSQNTKELAANNALLNDLQIRVIDVNEDRGYIQTPYDNLNVTRVLLDGVECDNNSGIAPSKTLKLNLSSCSDNISSTKPQLTIETNQGIIQKQIQELGIDTNHISSSFDCSNLPGNWTNVPGNAYFSISDFCVMKFEAKDVGGVATSQPSLTPWDNINFTDSREECNQLNSEHSSFSGTFGMITNREWMTIARNVEQQDANWDSGTIGSGSVFRGHSDNNPSNTLAVGNTSDYYNGTGNSAISSQKRVFELSNGDIIWDLAGNIYEWVDTSEDGSSFNGNACSGPNSWYSYFGSNPPISECSFNLPFSKDSATDARYEMGPLGNYNANNGIGRIYSYSASGRVMLRGGHWSSGIYSGAFTAILNNDPSPASANAGFRCSYHP